MKDSAKQKRPFAGRMYADTKANLKDKTAQKGVLYNR